MTTMPAPVSTLSSRKLQIMQTNSKLQIMHGGMHNLQLLICMHEAENACFAEQG
jgi:hypothetical protein